MSENKASQSKVSIQHPEYIRMVPQWKKCRDTSAGQRAVHEAGEEYLPSLSEQDTNEYNAYKLRAQFFNATKRTIKALSGMLFRKPPEVEVPGACEPLLEDVTTDGKDFTTFAQQVALEVETVGRVGILVDYPPESVEGLTQAEAEKRNLRPSMNYYITESIINWRVERINNEMMTTLVVLCEQASVSDNVFEHETETRYRVLDLISSGELGMIYRVRVFKVKDGVDIQIDGDLFPTMNGKNLSTIPFFFISTDDTTPEVEEPPLIDLVDANLAHYRLDADLKHGLHFTGLPQPWIAGYRDEDEKLCIGSSSAWQFPDSEANASYLEFTGQGLSALSDEKEKIAEQMAILGARMLAVEKKDSETAQTATIHRAGENSILESVAINIGIGLTQAMDLFCAWAGSESDSVLVTLNKDFIQSYMDPQELTAWVSALQTGSVSQQEFFWTLQQREAVPPDQTFEDHQTQIENGSRV